MRARLVCGDDAVPIAFQPFDRQQLGRGAHRLIDGNRKADPLGAGPHGDVQADHLAVDIQQRTARVAGIDAGVGLDQVVVALRIADLHRAMQGADDAARDRVFIAVGVAHRDHRFADHQIAGGADGDDRQFLSGSRS